jgi:hypothetical protein
MNRDGANMSSSRQFSETGERPDVHARRHDAMNDMHSRTLSTDVWKRTCSFVVGFYTQWVEQRAVVYALNVCY